MRATFRVPSAMLVVLALIASSGPVSSGPPPGRIEGLVIGVDGRPAPAHRVRLIDAAGVESATAVTDRTGLYSVRDVPPGEYGLALETPDGQVAPVSAPVRLRAGELRRHDLRLLEGEPADQDAAAQSSGGLGAWWAGLSTAAKVWVIVGSVAVVGVTYAAVTDDDDEPEASPSE